LRIDELLSLQTPVSEGPEHDETLFIVIHQVYELWFKQVLHEVELLRHCLEIDDVARVLSTFKRILTILKTLVGQVDILETMTPVSFNSFRDRLDSASGFQSFQFRLVEYVLGHRRPEVLQWMPEGSDEMRRLQEEMGRPSLYASFLRFLAANTYPIPADVLERDPALSAVEDERVRKILVQIYREDPTSREVCERMVDLDEGLQEWRYRHIKMVQRTIGMKTGTGGSAGSEYLRTTLFKPLFPDLWTIRTSL
jgi:tryptophan 2,3-dioxygenase